MSASVCFFIFLNKCLEAATVWDGGGGTDTSIQNAANWSNGLPSITNPGTVTGNVTVTYNTSSDLDDTDLLFDAGAGSPTVSGSTLTLNGTRLRVDGATEFTVDGVLRGGQAAGAGGATIELLGDSIFTVTGIFLLGLTETSTLLQSDNAVLNVNGGQFDVGNSPAAATASATPTPNGSIYTINGGELNVATLLRARFNSELNLNGGEVNIGTNLSIIESSRLNIRGGDINVVSGVQLQATGGVADISGGTITTGINFTVTGANSRLNVSGGTVEVGENLNFTGTGSTGDFTGGVVNVGNNTAVNGANNVVTVDGADFSTRNLTLSNNGVFNANSGIISTSNEIRVQTGAIFNQNTDVSIATNLALSNGVGGTFNANSGILSVGGNININEPSIFNQLGSDVTVGRNLNINDDGSTYNATIGDLRVGGNIILSNDSTLNQNGSDITVGNNILLRDTASYNATNGNSTIENNINLNGDSTFNQLGSNIIVDNNINLFDASAFNLDNGVLQVATDINVAATSTFNFNSGGILSVHDSASIIDYNGNLNATGGTLDLDAMTEHLDVSGTLDITELTIDGYTLNIPRIGGIQEDSVLLVTAGLLAGDLDNINYTNFIVNAGGTQLFLADPLTTTSDEFFYFDTSNNEIRLSYRIIPEPSSLLLILLGGSFLALRRKRKG